MVKRKSKRSPRKSDEGKCVTAGGDRSSGTELVNRGNAALAGSPVSESSSRSKCPHVVLCQGLTAEDVRLAREKDCCDECNELDRRLWFCLSDLCGQVFCGSKASNHSDEHFKRNPSHLLQLNLRSGRIWCLKCDCEVFLHSNIPAFAPSVLEAISRKHFKQEPANKPTSSEIALSTPVKRESIVKAKSTRTLLPIRGRLFNDHGETRRAVMVDVEDDYDDCAFPRGLTGLCNLGNTCYLNAALQALSNCSPLAELFRSSSSMAPFASHCMSRTFEPPLSRAFRLLLQTIWSPSRSGCTSPQLLLTQIRVHCPQFRGWGQQDAQELIRCLLDLIHRELRQPVYSWENRIESPVNNERQSGKNSTLLALRSRPIASQSSTVSGSDVAPVRRNSSSSSSSQCSNSVDRYETADSGWSSDGDTCTASASTVTSSTTARKRCRSMSPGALERLSVCDSAVAISERPSRRSRPSPFKKFTEAPRYYRSIVNDVFDGQLRSTVKCLTCHHISETYETFQDLSLCIPTKEQLDRLTNAAYSKEGCFEGNSLGSDNSPSRGWLWWLGIGWLRSFYGYIFSASISLTDTLNAFFSPDDLRDDNMYSCEKCGKLRNGVKLCKITRLPEVLCIHLKRFRHDSSYSTKVTTSVSFPLYDLDLSPFVSSSSAVQNELAVYDLCAFVTHHGNSAESGHYLAYCKNELDNNWYEFDDTVVTKLEPADVLSKEAYVLFYQRKSTQRIEKVKNAVRRLFEEELNQNKKRSCLPHYYISRDWLHRLSAFSHPGPITNYDFLCQHAQILPRKSSDLAEHYAVVELPTWEYLHAEFGGGPACTELHYCTLCQREYQWLQHKRDYEVKTFRAVENRIREAAAAFPPLTYGYYLPPNAISKSWLLKWRAFVDGEDLVPPGVIDNSSLLVRSATDSLTYFRRSANYVELPRELWLFFVSIYGGGPEVFYTLEPHPTEEEIAEWVANVEPKIKDALEVWKTRQLSGSSNPMNDSQLTFQDLSTEELVKDPLLDDAPNVESDYETILI